MIVVVVVAVSVLVHMFVAMWLFIGVLLLSYCCFGCSGGYYFLFLSVCLVLLAC